MKTSRGHAGLPWIGSLAVVAGMLALAPRATASPEPPAPPSAEDAWNRDSRALAAAPAWCPVGGRRYGADVSIPVWIPGVTGSFASGSTSVSTSRPDGDSISKAPEVVSKIEFAFVGRVDAYEDRWRFFGDVFGAHFADTADFRVNALDAEADVVGAVGRLLLGYRVVEACPDPCRTTVDVDAFAGARLCYARLALDEPEALAFSRSKFWIDPIVGGRLHLDFPGRLDLSLMADVGGFDVGSKLSWSATAELSYPLSRRVSLAMGYSWLSIDYRCGTGSDRFVYNLDLHGPLLALTFHF